MSTEPPTPPDTNGQARSDPALDKPAGEAVPKRSRLDGIEDGMRADQIESLGWLRRWGMHIAERLDRKATGLLMEREAEAFQGVDVALAFSRVSRAVRQIIVLEQETAGFREMRRPRHSAPRSQPPNRRSPPPPSRRRKSRRLWTRRRGLIATTMTITTITTTITPPFGG